MIATDEHRSDHSLRERATGGVIWNVGQRWAARLGGFVTVLVLARMLTPEAFGLVAGAMAILPVIYLFADLGFSTYIVQADRVTPRLLASAMWYALAAGALLTVGLVAAAPMLAGLFGTSELTGVLIALAPTIMLVAVSSVPIALLRRRMAFRSLAIQSMVAAALGQVVAIVLAVGGFGVWALVWQTLVTQATVAVCAWCFARYRPTLAFSWREIGEMTHFGMSVIAVELVAVSRLWAETAIVSSTLGITGLGYLNIAQRLVQTTQDLSAAAITPVSTVVFAQIRAAVDRLARSYQQALSVTYAIVSPVLVTVAVAAPLLVPLLFGDQWDESIDPARALAVAGILTLGATLDHGLFYGAGRPGRWLGYAIVIDALTVVGTAIGVRYGLSGVAAAFVAVAVVASIVRWFMVARLLRTPVRFVAMPVLTLLPAMAASALVAGGVLWLSAGLPAVAALALIAVAAVATHVAGVWLIRRDVFALVVSLVRQLLRRGSGDPGAKGGAHARR